MGQKVKSYQRELRVITGNDNQKASVGFKAFGLRTEGSSTDFTGLLFFFVER